jgi:hypothetical protein
MKLKIDRIKRYYKLSQIFVSLFPELYLSRHLFIFSKMSGCARGQDLRVHVCTRALISRHRPTASPFHTQTLLRPRIPGRRALDWTSIVP